MFHWTDPHIRVHVFYCVLALAVAHLMRREANRAGLPLSFRQLLGHLAGIQETVLLYPSTGGRPRARRILTEMDPTQHDLFDLFTLDPYAPPQLGNTAATTKTRPHKRKQTKITLARKVPLGDCGSGSLRQCGRPVGLSPRAQPGNNNLAGVWRLSIKRCPTSSSTMRTLPAGGVSRSRGLATQTPSMIPYRALDGMDGTFTRTEADLRCDLAYAQIAQNDGCGRQRQGSSVRVHASSTCTAVTETAIDDQCDKPVCNGLGWRGHLDGGVSTAAPASRRS